MKYEISRQVFENSRNIKFNHSSSSGGRVVPCGQMDGRKDRWTDMTTIIVTSRNFSKAPENDKTVPGLHGEK